MDSGVLVLEEQVYEHVDIDSAGAVTVAGLVSIDGFYRGVVARITTHVHVDHVRGLRDSLRTVSAHIASPLTHDMLTAYGYSVPYYKRVDAPYGTKIGIEDLYVKLLPANHIPGAAEVYVETASGLTILYTGDFKMPGTEIVRDVDVLVMEATYGMPEWRRPWQQEMEYILPELVNTSLSNGPVHIYAYGGKIEEVVVLLRRMDVTAPVIVDSKRYKSLRILENHGYKIGEVLSSTSRESFEAKRSGWYIEFHSFNMWKRRGSIAVNGSKGVHMLLTGWEFRKPYYWVSARDVIVSFSDHADFTQLVDYVLETRPKLVITDASRAGVAARVFSEYLRQRHGVKAYPRP